MLPGNKDIKLSAKLLRWYRTHHRNLPWRDTKDPYKIWISEIMLQQTTVNAVIPYYRKWMKLFPSIQILSQAPTPKVLKTWQGLGYYNRVKNLLKASRILVKDYSAKIPRDYTAVRNLPGFGPYTTAAVLSIAYNLPYPVIDGNVRRLLLRITGLEVQADPKYDKILLKNLQPHLPSKNMGIFNQAMMELGALVCTPRNPRCLLCPLPSFCQAFKTGKPEVIPQPKKTNTQKIEAAVAIIQNKKKFLIQKRPSQGLLADFWEFPGGKRKNNETLLETVRREVKEELHTDTQEETFLTKVKHSYTQYQVTLYAYQCSLRNPPQISEKRHRWITLKELRQYPLPSGSAKIVDFLERKSKIINSK